MWWLSLRWPYFAEARPDLFGKYRAGWPEGCHSAADEQASRECRAGDGEQVAQSTDVGGSVAGSTSQHEELCRGLSDSQANPGGASDSSQSSPEASEDEEEEDSLGELDDNFDGKLLDLPFYRHVTTDMHKQSIAAGRASAVTAFSDMLEGRGVSIVDVDALYRECRELARCVIAADPAGGPPKRLVRSVQIRLLADIFGVEHVLFTRLEISRLGKATERQQLPTWSLQWNETEPIFDATDEALFREGATHTESWITGCKRGLRRLGLSYEWQAQHLEEDVHLNTFLVEPEQASATHPGISEVCMVHQVVFRVVDPSHPAVRCIGLPSGQEFATSEHSTLGGPGDDATVKIWAWGRSASLDGAAGSGSLASPLCRSSPIKRVPLPTLSGESICRFQQRLARGSFEFKAPSPVLRVVQEGRMTDWKTVWRMSQRIRDSDYSLDMFYRDLCAFPELDLYLLENDAVPGLIACSDTGAAAAISGRTIGDEYQRTVGAFFSIYWLMRLSHDGRLGFCFGVDEQYRPIRSDAGDERLYPAEKRLKFYSESQWEQFDQLLFDAGLLVKDDAGAVVVDSVRVATVLALTAIHDIMKVKALLPKVAPQHDHYHGYRAGDTIGDHDHALSYVMDHFPELLPSFKGLQEEEQRSVQFTQCELCFNHGWLVQAEAPPGAIFTRFRQMIAIGKDSSRDVALYFVHWLTDLAGAEPTPLSGSEKFVIKFPLPVLNSFLKSFKTVQRIATDTETEVMEGYLVSRWLEHAEALGPLPEGPAAIAKLRLLCMAQMNAEPILDGFGRLPPEDQRLLSVEMALTACDGQRYSDSLIPVHDPLLSCGPAFLVYYGPAFLQSLGSDCPVRRLQILARIYGAARELWPPSAEQAGRYVTIRIDAIKGLSVSEICDTEGTSETFWAVVRKNVNEAFVDQVPSRKVSQRFSAGADEAADRSPGSPNCDIAPLGRSHAPLVTDGLC